MPVVGGMDGGGRAVRRDWGNSGRAGVRASLSRDEHIVGLTSSWLHLPIVSSGYCRILSRLQEL